MSNLNQTGGGLQYRGTKALQPPNCNFFPRDPNDFDRANYSLLDFWLNTESEDLWVLVALAGTSTSAGIRATWVKLTIATSASGVVSLTGNDSVAVFPDGSGNLNLIGTDPLFVTGTPGTHTETITVASATTGQLGVVMLANNSQTITGTNTTRAVTPASLSAKLGAQTADGIAYGNGTTSAINWTSAGTDGQVIIAATGSDPEFANLISSDGSITITNGPNSIDLEVATPSGGSSIKTTVYNTPGTYAFTKDPLTKSLAVYGWSGGGGGNIGGTSNVPGGGGAGGCMYYTFPSFFVDDSPTTIPVIVGSGGAGATPGPTPTAGAGTPSSFGNFITGSNQWTGSNPSVLGGSGSMVTNAGPAWPGDTNASTVHGITGSISFLGYPSGGQNNVDPGPSIKTDQNSLGSMLPAVGGGWRSDLGTGGPGGSIKRRSDGAVLLAGGSGGAVGINGGNGLNSYPNVPGLNFMCGGSGGGGGGTGARGGNGGFPGGGGGSGQIGGGNGGNGLVIVIEYLSS